jgi:hypothetical protein
MKIRITTQLIIAKISGAVFAGTACNTQDDKR